MPDDDAEAVAALGHENGTDAVDPDVPEDLQRTFWTIVGLANVGLFAVSLGVMLLVFRGQGIGGVASLLIGAVALALAVRRYRRRNA